jgi:hypothetical protein
MKTFWLWLFWNSPGTLAGKVGFLPLGEIHWVLDAPRAFASFPHFIQIKEQAECPGIEIAGH